MREDLLFWLFVFVQSITFIGAIVCLIIAIRHLRKLSEILRGIEADFPVLVNKVTNGKQRNVDTSVEITGEWDEKEEPRS